MVEVECYLLVFFEKIEVIVDENGFCDKEIIICMMGCFNGCVCFVLGEIVFIGKVLGKYNMYFGVVFDGSCLSKMYCENISEEEILNELCVLFFCYVKEREEGEYFGDFVICVGVIEVVIDGMNFYV